MTGSSARTPRDRRTGQRLRTACAINVITACSSQRRRRVSARRGTVSEGALSTRSCAKLLPTQPRRRVPISHTTRRWAGLHQEAAKGIFLQSTKSACRWFDSAPGHHPQFFETQRVSGITGGLSVAARGGNRPTTGLSDIGPSRGSATRSPTGGAATWRPGKLESCDVSDSPSQSRHGADRRYRRDR